MVLWDHGRLVCRQRAQHVRRRIVEIEYRSMCIRCVDAGHFFKRIWPPWVHLFQDFHNGELDVCGRKRLAIMPCDTFTQIKGDGFTVRADVIALGQNWDHFPVVVIVKQTVIYLWSQQADRA